MRLRIIIAILLILFIAGCAKKLDCSSPLLTKDDIENVCGVTIVHEEQEETKTSCRFTYWFEYFEEVKGGRSVGYIQEIYTQKEFHADLSKLNKADYEITNELGETSVRRTTWDLPMFYFMEGKNLYKLTSLPGGCDMDQLVELAKIIETRD